MPGNAIWQNLAMPLAKSGKPGNVWQTWQNLAMPGNAWQCR
jgi:hypothetical protein